MQALSLTEKEKIDLLTDGVKDPILRKMLLSTWITNIPDYLEQVRRITEDSTFIRRGETNYQSGGHYQYSGKDVDNRKEITCFNCKQEGHLSKDCTQKKMTWLQMRRGKPYESGVSEEGNER